MHIVGDNVSDYISNPRLRGALERARDDSSEKSSASFCTLASEYKFFAFEEDKEIISCLSSIISEDSSSKALRAGVRMPYPLRRIR